MNIKDIVRPATLVEAYEMLQEEDAVVLGGGVFLHMGSKEIGKALDLSGLELGNIEDRGGELELGAMASLRDIEINSAVKGAYNGVLTKAVSSIMGVQLRNAATLGGSVWGRYGFSDILTTLLALEADVVLFNRGRISLEKFLEEEIKKDILLRVVLKNNNGFGAFASLRATELDFPILNSALVIRDGQIRICVGARPFRAKVAVEAMKFINVSGLNEYTALRAGEIASESLGFGEDMRASAEYRKEICKVLVKRCVLEVLK